MTQEEILDYNKLCAEFLGWNKTHPKIKGWYIYITPIGHVSYDKMLFHSDWNWIMEVVDKIAMYYKDKEIPQIHLLNQPIFTPKEAVVSAINQFLIWYNENKTKKDNLL